MKRKSLLMFCLFLVVAWLSGCATFETEKKAVPYRLTAQGTVIWEDEFEFLPPPPDWKLLRVETGENDINFGFTRSDPGTFPSMTAFAYDEEPFGCSTKFEDREREFFKRFLFNAILQFQVLEKKKVQVLGAEGFEVTVEGKDPIKKEKVRAKVVFGKRGERIVGFYITQWRPIDGTYDLSAFEVFDRFVKSFKLLKKSFYETL
ncbi:MAG: hypothetical protein FJ106_20025 [Deltaproteobacteria bacterium]|nr:hypothetical protein [Deltaproteobacteria bacterium]